MLALLPVDPRPRTPGGEPALDRPAELGLARQARGERELVETDPVDVSKLAKAAKPIELARGRRRGTPRESVPGTTSPSCSRYRSIRGDQPLELRGLSNSQCLHVDNLTTKLSRRLSAREAGVGPSAHLEVSSGHENRAGGEHGDGGGCDDQGTPEPRMPFWSGEVPSHQKAERKRNGSSQPASECRPETR